MLYAASEPIKVMTDELTLELDRVIFASASFADVGLVNTKKNASKARSIAVILDEQRPIDLTGNLDTVFRARQ